MSEEVLAFDGLSISTYVKNKLSIFRPLCWCSWTYLCLSRLKSRVKTCVSRPWSDRSPLNFNAFGIEIRTLLESFRGNVNELTHSRVGINSSRELHHHPNGSVTACMHASRVDFIYNMPQKILCYSAKVSFYR